MTAQRWRKYSESKATLLRNDGETLKIESTLPKRAAFYIQCPNDVMPDPESVDSGGPLRFVIE